MKQHRFLREALDEYQDAVAYYESVRPGLGARFLAEFDRALALTLEFPEMGAPVDEAPPALGIRRRVLQHFGVEIAYMKAGDALVILAVFHGRRRPGYWKDRLRQ